MSMIFDALVLDADGTNATLTTGTAGVGGNVVSATTINGPWRDIAGVDEGEYGMTVPPQATAGALQLTLQFADDIVTPTIKETATLPLLGTGGEAVPATGEVYWLRWGHRRRYMRSVLVTTGGSVSFLGMMAGLCSGAHELNRAG
jgi:hypothetical protein